GGSAASGDGGWWLTITTPSVPVCCSPDSAADLALGLSSSASTVVLGSNITYTLNVTNLGPYAAADAIATDALPPQLSFVSAISTIGTCTNDNGTILCSLGTLTNGARATITIVVSAVSTGSVTNTFSVSSLTGDPLPT